MTPVIYSVTSSVAEADAQAFAHWMQHEHVPAVLATGCFTGARMLQVSDQEPDHRSFNVQYRCTSQAELDRYLAEHAPRLRGETAAAYGDRVVSFRTVLLEVAAW